MSASEVSKSCGHTVGVVGSKWVLRPCGREAPAASEASDASEARHARSKAARFVTANCT